MGFRERSYELYSGRAHHILPFIGEAFEGNRPEPLRVVPVGINTHIAPKDWDPDKHHPHPGWFAAWFEKTERKHNKRMRRDAEKILDALTRLDGPFKGSDFSWPGSCYATNAIKVHLRDAEGKRADQVSESLFDDHMGTWYAELDLMAEYGVLPHVIMIFGEPFWSRACDSFRAESARKYQHLRVARYQHYPGPCLHHVNRLRLVGAAGLQDTLLLKLRHPAGRTMRGSAQWLLVQDAFTQAVADSID